MDILDKKSEEEIARHKSNFYRKGLSSRGVVGSDSFFSLENIISDHSLFRVPIDKFSGFEGHHYNDHDPLVRTSLELLENSDLEYSQSFLFNYYKSFQPQTYGEVYRLKKDNKLHTLSQTSFFHPWIHSTPTSEFRQGLFGPKHITNVIHRMTRLKNLINNINKFGYIPDANDIVKGYILLKNNDYRFLITSGHHRVAVMAAINILDNSKFNNILVKYETKRSNIKIVRSAEARSWPGVIRSIIDPKGGFLMENDALEMFNAYFI